MVEYIHKMMLLEGSFVFQLILACCGVVGCFISLQLVTSSPLKAALISIVIAYLMGISIFNVNQDKLLSQNTVEFENWLSICFGYICGLLISWMSSHSLGVKLHETELIIQVQIIMLSFAFLALLLAAVCSWVEK
jgi:hypothetical protein